jgi:hypothetical protein
MLISCMSLFTKHNYSRKVRLFDLEGRVQREWTLSVLTSLVMGLEDWMKTTWQIYNYIFFNNFRQFI